MTTQPYTKADQVRGRSLTELGTARLRGLVLEAMRERVVKLASDADQVYRAHFNEAEPCTGTLCITLASYGQCLDAALGALDRAIAANEGTEHAEDATAQQGHRALPEEDERQAEGA